MGEIRSHGRIMLWKTWASPSTVIWTMMNPACSMGGPPFSSVPTSLSHLEQCTISVPFHGVWCSNAVCGPMLFRSDLPKRPESPLNQKQFFSLCLRKSRCLANIYWWMYWGWRIVMQFNNCLKVNTKEFKRNTNKEKSFLTGRNHTLQHSIQTEPWMMSGSLQNQDS